MKRRAAALRDDGFEQIAERAAADEEGERLVLVRRPGAQAREQERAEREGACADAKAKHSGADLFRYGVAHVPAPQGIA